VTDVVRLEVDDRGITWITLARPEVRNAFDADLIAQLGAILGRIDPTSRAVVLRSDGDAFCAGADLNWMRGMADFSLAENVADSRALAQMFRALDELPMPLLARVQGAAIGGGCGLVAVADIAVASSAAVFAFTEVRLGILPAVVSPYVVRKIGFAHATALFTTGIRFDATRAHEVGLVEAVEEPGKLDETITFYLDAIVAGGPHAVNAAKRLVREVAGRPVAEVREKTVERIAGIRVSDEGQEGMRSFLERRKPKW
jgi:methylglutaconyl-CoA hydratase